jgi:hypothetical protein
MSLFADELAEDFFNRLGPLMRQRDQLSQGRSALPPQAWGFPLTNLKTHLIIMWNTRAVS